MHVVYYWGFGEFKKIKSEVTNNFWEGTKKFDIFRLCRWFENDFGEWGWVEEESQREWVIILLAAPLFFHCLVTILMHDFLPPFVFCSKLPSDHQTTLSSIVLFLLLSILVQYFTELLFIFWLMRVLTNYNKYRKWGDSFWIIPGLQTLSITNLAMRYILGFMKKKSLICHGFQPKTEKAMRNHNLPSLVSLSNGFDTKLEQIFRDCFVVNIIINWGH